MWLAGIEPASPPWHSGVLPLDDNHKPPGRKTALRPGRRSAGVGEQNQAIDIAVDHDDARRLVRVLLHGVAGQLADLVEHLALAEDEGRLGALEDVLQGLEFLHPR